MLNFAYPQVFALIQNLAVENSPKIKKAVRRDEKLFIGLTTKPRYELQIRSKQHN